MEPLGGTALNDAIGHMIVRLGNKFKTMPEDKRPAHVIVVIATDGAENSSREYTHAAVKQMVEEQTEKWQWTFVYLAANVDAFATGGAYGFAKGSTISVAGTRPVVRGGVRQHEQPHHPHPFGTLDRVHR